MMSGPVMENNTGDETRDIRRREGWKSWASQSPDDSESLPPQRSLRTDVAVRVCVLHCRVLRNADR